MQSLCNHTSARLPYTWMNSMCITPTYLQQWQNWRVREEVYHQQPQSSLPPTAAAATTAWSHRRLCGLCRLAKLPFNALIGFLGGLFQVQTQVWREEAHTPVWGPGKVPKRPAASTTAKCVCSSSTRPWGSITAASLAPSLRQEMCMWRS